MNLENKVIVVTGASAGLGRQFSADLVDRGAQVFGLARRTDRLNQIKSELGEAFTGIECDVSEERSVDAAFHAIADAADSLDVLINNAGLGRFGALDELSLEDWDVQMNVNLRGIFLCSRRAAPVMKRQNSDSGFGGHIVNISSVAGLLGNPGIGAYNASKFGVRGLSESMFKELREDGIKVSCIYPGSIETEFFEKADVTMTPNPMTSEDISSTLMHVLETHDNYLISEVVMRPLRPRG